MLARDDQAAFFTASDDGQSRVAAQRIQRRVEIGRLVQAVQLALIGEDEVHRAGPNELEKFQAIAIDAERIRQCEGDIALRRVRDLRSLEESFLGARRIPEVAFKINDLSGSNGIRVDVVGMQILSGAEIGVHRALAVGRHQHVTTCRGWAGRCGRRRKGDTRRADIMGKDAPKLIILDLSNEGRARPQARDPDDRIGRGATGNLHGRAHGVVKLRGPRLIDQLHGAFAHFLLRKEPVVGPRDHINDRIADTENIKSRRGHPKALPCKSARNIAVERLEAIALRRTRSHPPCECSHGSGPELHLHLRRPSCHLATRSARFPHAFQGTSVFRRTADRQSSSR